MNASNNDKLKFSKRQQTRNPVLTSHEFKAIKNNERSLQSQCENYLIANQISFIRVPDAVYKAVFGNKSLPVYLKTLISSFIKGLPDLIILKKETTYNSALCIELKTAKGKMSQGQKNFAKKVNVIIVRSFEDFEKTVNEFIQIGK